MKLSDNCKYDLVTVTSMGVRIVPADRQPVHTSNLYEMQSTSAETNVLNISASLGMRTKALTKFVSGSPVASFLQSELRKRNIEYEGIEIPQEGPWGFRHQFNIADSGCGMRGPRVHNDRAGEIGRTIAADDFDLKKLFCVDKCRVLHLSGLICALSPATTECCLAIAKIAKENGTVISFDLNYRESFWKGRKNELRQSFRKIASVSDILIGNEEDFQLALGISGPESGGKELAGKIEGFQSMIEQAQKEFPDVSVFATTLREVYSANRHLWGAIMLADKKWYTELPREIDVYDRIGGGDGFVGGLLYGILKEMPAENWIKFGWATGALAVTMATDYATPVDEEQVWSIYNGNARVKR